MFIELFFVATLDMSMPEFQPQEDISGNVIVSEVDDVSGEFIAEEVPLNEIPIEKTSDLPLLGLSQEEDPTEKFVQEVPSLHSIGLNNLSVSNRNIQFDSSTQYIGQGSTIGIKYVYLEPFTTYYFETNAPRIFICDNFNSGTYCDAIYDYSKGYSFNLNKYAFVSSTRNFVVSYNQIGDTPGGDVSGDEPGGDVSGDETGGSINVDLTTVESQLDNVITLQRSILMTLLVTFLFPIIKSCVNLLKGGKDV